MIGINYSYPVSFFSELSDDDSEIDQSENIAHSDSNDDSGMDTPKKNPQLKDFDKCGKTQRREIVLPIINLITKICAERNTTFNALAGSAGRLYFNGDGVALENAKDFANMYQIISNNQNPFPDHKVSDDKALYLREKIIDLGRSNWQDLRDKVGHDTIPSRYHMDKYAKSLLPEIGKKFPTENI